MTIRLLFADDQLPSPLPSENERTRSEIRRERPDIANLDRAFDDDFEWFTGLLDYLEKTKGVRVTQVRSFAEAEKRIEDTSAYDVAIVDMSWWGDGTLPPGRKHRHNRGLELLSRIADLRAGGAPVATIALSQNFADDFELMSTALEMQALPMPKSYDRQGLGFRAIYSGIEYLARTRNGARTDGGSRVQIFISHSHRDVDLARCLVEAVENAMDLPPGAIRCTSVPGYKLDLGAMPRDALRVELSSAACVVALITPHSLASEWCAFELGAAWVLAKETLPLVVGRLTEDDLPAAIRGAAVGHAGERTVLSQLLEQIKRRLGRPPRNEIAAQHKLDELVEIVSGKTFFEDDVEKDLASGFAAKRARIGATQGAILDYIHHRRGDRALVPQDEIERHFQNAPTKLFYRLEQLRFLGFLRRQQMDARGELPYFGWALSSKYESEIG